MVFERGSASYSGCSPPGLIAAWDMAGYTARLSWRFNGTDPKHKRINSHALTALAASGKEIFKFVATTPNGIDEIAHRQNHFKLDPIWV
ncbi:MAG: hypothetical protein ACRDTT_01880, partial [Pseudonocardiaceae bacterium]